MSAPLSVTYFADADQVGWIVFDDHGSGANVINLAAHDAFAAAIAQAERDPGLKALIVTSGPEQSFSAGADLNEIAALPSPEAATDFSRRGQRLFQRLAAFRVPVVAAIHGTCLGGGYELALACHWRIASDAPVTRIGLPETSLGTIPGWGGCVRLPRLVGVKPALDHILKAQVLSAFAARDTGLVDELVPAGELRAKAKARAIQLAGEGERLSSCPAAPAPDFFAELRRTLRVPSPGETRAWHAAIDVIERSSNLSLTDALEVEARVFGEVTSDVVCQNLVRVFFLRDAAKKRTLEGWFAPRDGFSATLQPIQRVGVVGAGVMGSGIAHWLAAHGIDVAMRDVRADILEAGLIAVRGLFDEAVRRGKLTAGGANSALRRVSTSTGWDGFETCELVIEAIVENREEKRALFTELARVAPPNAILASNTSAIPIEEIAGPIPAPGRTLGIHFFNPVSRMPLVELVIGRQTTGETAARVLALMKTLGKSPLFCRSSPGFLVTRVLFFYLNAAARLWEEGASAADIDGAMREFGWPMGPLRLIDEVGVDVTDSIFGEMQQYFPERFTRSTVCSRMLAQGLRGRKNGASRGFYRYDSGKEAINEQETLPLFTTSSRSPGRERSDIADQLMAVMVDEAERCLDEGIVKSADDIDFALVSGAGFPAFRGGLLHWARGSRLAGGKR